jgi:hypothetical protein
MIDALNEASQILPNIDLNNASYKVNLRSLFEPQKEKSITTLHIGSLEKAIKIAESDFRTTNNRLTIQAVYTVELQVGRIPFQIPQNFWQQYISR